MKFDTDALYEKIKTKPTQYDEDTHCKMVLRIMADPLKGSFAAFCVEANISDDKFYRWIYMYPTFGECYLLGKMISRYRWEQEGKDLKHLDSKMLGCNFELWRMEGWSKFGVGKNSRIRLNLDPKDNPAQHYAQLLQQAGQGDFTAGEIKQLMEAVNVGLNAHKTFELQKEIDQLKADYAKLNEIRHDHNIYTNKGTS